MADKAFVLIETVVGRSREVVTALKKMDGVKEADIVSGPYDVIAIVEMENINDIGELLTAKIQTTAGIFRAVTCIKIFEG